MDAILTQAQEALLKQTRDALGRLRDALADSAADPAGRAALVDSIRQLDELFLLVTPASSTPASRLSSTPCSASRSSRRA